MKISDKPTILVWKGKYDTKIFDISSPDKERAVCMGLFRYFDLKGYYSGGVTIKGVRQLLTSEEVAQNVMLVKRLLVERSIEGFEDQQFDMVAFENP